MTDRLGRLRVAARRTTMHRLVTVEALLEATPAWPSCVTEKCPAPWPAVFCSQRSHTLRPLCVDRRAGRNGRLRQAGFLRCSGYRKYHHSSELSIIIRFPATTCPCFIRPPAKTCPYLPACFPTVWNGRIFVREVELQGARRGAAFSFGCYFDG